MYYTTNNKLRNFLLKRISVLLQRFNIVLVCFFTLTTARTEYRAYIFYISINFKLFRTFILG